jgi:hypothetical protein
MRPMTGGGVTVYLVVMRSQVVRREGSEMVMANATRAYDSDDWRRRRLACRGESLLCAVKLQQPLFEAGFIGWESVRVGFEVALEVFLRRRCRGWKFCGLYGVEDVTQSFDHFIQTQIFGPVAKVGFNGEGMLPLVTFVPHHQLFEKREIGFETAILVVGCQVRHPEASVLGFDVQIQKGYGPDWRRDRTDEHVGVARMRKREAIGGIEHV